MTLKLLRHKSNLATLSGSLPASQLPADLLEKGKGVGGQAGVLFVLRGLLLQLISSSFAACRDRTVMEPSS